MIGFDNKINQSKVKYAQSKCGVFIYDKNRSYCCPGLDKTSKGM